MERVHSSLLATALFLTLVALAAAGASGSGDDAAAADVAHPLAGDEPYMQLDDDEQGYMLFCVQTGGGDKVRLVVVADQRYFSITGYAGGFSNRPRWSFRDDDRHRLLPLGGHDGSSSRGSSHAEVVASNALRELWNTGRSWY